jgi:uncharacterized membrane protein YphA (DoxX/SURF4 family)
MLNIFPILFLAPLGIFILRVTVGFLLVKIGFTTFRTREHRISFTMFGILECIIGILYILGLGTQIAALATCLVLIPFLIYARTYSGHEVSKMFLILLMSSALTLFTTGAGIFAFDIPI